MAYVSADKVHYFDKNTRLISAQNLKTIPVSAEEQSLKVGLISAQNLERSQCQPKNKI